MIVILVPSWIYHHFYLLYTLEQYNQALHLQKTDTKNTKRTKTITRIFIK